LKKKNETSEVSELWICSDRQNHHNTVTQAQSLTSTFNKMRTIRELLHIQFMLVFAQLHKMD